MKKNNFRIIASLLIVSILSACFFSCDGTEKLKYTDGVFVDPSSNSEYVPCSPSIIAAAIGEKKAKFADIYYHIIPGYENGEFLTQKFEDGYEVIRKKDVHEPALSELNITNISVCRITDTSVFAEAQTEDKELISKITEAVLTPPSEDEDTLLPANPVFTRELRIFSDNYPYLCYRISYLEDTRGQGYLYDRATGICKNVGGLLIGKLL